MGCMRLATITTRRTKHVGIAESSDVGSASSMCLLCTEHSVRKDKLEAIDAGSTSALTAAVKKDSI